MKILAVTLLTLAAATSAMAKNLKNITNIEDITAYGYLRKIGVPLAKKIRKAEQEADRTQNRIVGGEYSYIDHFPYQAGLLISTLYGDGICGGSLLNARRVLTAGHCWNDGVTKGFSIEVILGSTRLYGNDGTRINTNRVVPHPRFVPAVTNDLAMIILPKGAVEYSNKIHPIALPSGKELRYSFLGWYVMASGYGFTHDDDSVSEERFLSYVHLPVISLEHCYAFPDIDISRSICASGARGKSICRGDSGGPIVVNSKNRLILVGVSSFGSISGCEKGYPSVFTRVTAYIKWIKSLLE